LRANGSRECAPDDRLREAIQKPQADWIASSQVLLAMTEISTQKRAGDPVSLNRLLVEDSTAIGYPRPAPLLAASDHVFFDDRTARMANRSTLIYLF